MQIIFKDKTGVVAGWLRQWTVNPRVAKGSDPWAKSGEGPLSALPTLAQTVGVHLQYARTACTKIVAHVKDPIYDFW